MGVFCLIRLLTLYLESTTKKILHLTTSAVKDAGESMIGRDTTVNLVARSNVTLSNEKVKGESNEKHNQASNVMNGFYSCNFLRNFIGFIILINLDDLQVNQKAESLINCSRKSSKNEVN